MSNYIMVCKQHFHRFLLSSGHGHENCGLKYRNEDTWRTDDCTKENLFMCYERLILVKENKTWEEALEHCRSLGDKVPADWNSWYDLATLMTEDDITYALQKAKPASSNEVGCFPAPLLLAAPPVSNCIMFMSNVGRSG